MPISQFTELALYYEIHGSGQPLLLIAGLNSDHGLFRTFVPRLAERFQVIVFDNRGIGQSTAPPCPFSVEMLADDAAALLAALGIARAHVLGISLGGRIAAALCLRHPALVASLVLVSTTMEPPPRSWHSRWVGLLLRVPAVRRGNPYSIVAWQRAATRAFNCTDRLHEIRVPTLILWGTKDPLVPRHLARSMREHITGSTMISFDGGHLFFIRRARQCMDAVLAFLAPLAL